jgi:hypothetical protein
MPMAARKNRRKSPVVLEDLSKPSQWRLQHGSFSEPIREPDPESGVPRAHRYAIDTLGVMLGNGTITEEMHDAGAMFRRHFRVASLDPLRGMSMLRIPGGSGDSLTEQQYTGRRRVAEAMEALGGFNSAGASCIWHVVGLEFSITEWARRHGWGGRIVGHAQAQGMLVVALGVLAAHYRLVPVH